MEERRPKSLQEAVNTILSTMTDEEKEQVRSSTEEGERRRFSFRKTREINPLGFYYLCRYFSKSNNLYIGNQRNRGSLL